MDYVEIPTNICLRIRNLKLGLNGCNRHSWRALAEVICTEYPDFIRVNYGSPEDLHGNQLLGKELCRDAEKSMGLKTWDID